MASAGWTRRGGQTEAQSRETRPSRHFPARGRGGWEGTGGRGGWDGSRIPAKAFSPGSIPGISAEKPRGEGETGADWQRPRGRARGPASRCTGGDTRARSPSSPGRPAANPGGPRAPGFPEGSPCRPPAPHQGFPATCPEGGPVRAEGLGRETTAPPPATGTVTGKRSFQTQGTDAGQGRAVWTQCGLRFRYKNSCRPMNGPPRQSPGNVPEHDGSGPPPPWAGECDQGPNRTFLFVHALLTLKF